MRRAKQLYSQNLNLLADAVHKNARKKGFHRREPWHVFLANQANNLHGEVSELWEAYRNGDFHKLCDKAEKMKKLGHRPLTCAEEEYADIIIRALDQCRRLDIDIVEAINIKHAYNLSRPYMHGGKRN